MSCCRHCGGLLWQEKIETRWFTNLPSCHLRTATAAASLKKKKNAELFLLQKEPSAVPKEEEEKKRMTLQLSRQMVRWEQKAEVKTPRAHDR